MYKDNKQTTTNIFREDDAIVTFVDFYHINKKIR